jgi:hypothetical protein
VRHASFPIVVSSALLASGGGASAALITDNTFDLANWSLSDATYGSPGSYSSASVDGSPGFEGKARVIQNYTADDGSGINSISIFLPQGWDGSKPLEQLTMSIHARILYSGQQLGFAVEQGGRFWIAGLFSNTASWELYTMALTATDFMLPFGVDPASQAAHPDFAAGAAPIRFGFHATNTTLPNWGGGYAMGRYSAFSVSFVPAPGVLAVLGGVALGRQRRTR